MENKLVNRRRALHVIGMTTGGVMLAACTQEKSGVPEKKEPKKAEAKKAAEEPAKTAAAGGAGCDAPIDESSKKLRATLQYVEKTPNEEKRCNNCLQYVEPAEGNKCGGCKLFTGPVQPNGYCLSWAAKQPA